MIEQYPTLSEALERPPLPRSAWSLESFDIYNSKSIKQGEPAKRNDLSLEQYMLEISYQSRRPRTLTSTQPTPQYYSEQPQTSRERKSRSKHQQSSNQDGVQANYVLPVLPGHRARWPESTELTARGHSSNSQGSRSKNRPSRARHSYRRLRHHESLRGSHSNHRRSKRKHRNKQLRSTSFTIFQWFLWKLSCGG